MKALPVSLVELVDATLEAVDGGQGAVGVGVSQLGTGQGLWCSHVTGYPSDKQVRRGNSAGQGRTALF